MVDVIQTPATLGADVLNTSVSTPLAEAPVVSAPVAETPVTSVAGNQGSDVMLTQISEAIGKLEQAVKVLAEAKSTATAEANPVTVVNCAPEVNAAATADPALATTIATTEAPAPVVAATAVQPQVTAPAVAL